MLAAVPHDIPLREHSHLDLHQSHSDPLVLEDRLCPGCKKSVVNEQGGLVVAFGQSFFHVDCFKCAKCRNQVTADTNLLLLSDGSPICANCSYSCNICHLPILDEAIMTGDDSYHAHCFKCKVCSKRIDELVFAKTSQGIYCMNCHNDRMIKIRKHAQKKAEREKAGGGSGSTRSREQEARNFHRDQDRPSTAETTISRSHSNLVTSAHSDSSRQPQPDNYRSPAKPIQGPYVTDAFEINPPSYSNSTVPRPLPLIQPTRSPSVVVAPPTSEIQTSSNLHQHNDQFNAPLKSNTLPAPIESLNSKRRSSYDDGVRPLNVLIKSDSLPPDPKNLYLSAHPSNDTLTQGLSVTSKRDKRRSINPGVSLSPLNPINISPPLQTSLSAHDQNASANLSNEPSSSQPPSRPDSDHGTASSTKLPDSRSRSSSIFDDSYYQNHNGHDATIVMASPPAMSIELEQHTEPSMSKTSQARNQESQGRDFGDSHVQRSSATLSPTEANGFRAQQRRTSSSSNFSVDRYTGNPSRSTSPAYHADVPHSVESGTDTENDTDGLSSDDAAPPVPPPKDARNSTRSSNLTVSDADVSDLSQFGDMSDDMTEVQPVERMSHSTFIAPALPPIRFSMNTADFADLLNSVSGLPSLKSLDRLSKESQDQTPSTPPPTATSFETFKQEITPTASETRLGPSAKNASTASTLTNVPEEHQAFEQQGLTVQTQLQSQSSSGPTSRAPSPIPSVVLPTPIPRRTDSDPDLIINRLREALSNAREKGSPHLKIELGFVDAVLEHFETRTSEYYQLKNKVDGMNRESKMYIEGMTVAQAEYDRELEARRDAEAEVTRLRVLLSGQAVRLTALSGDNRRQELRQQMSKELNDNLSGLEHSLSRLKVERDLALAEVEELSSKKSAANITEVGATSLGRSLTKRMENIRSQYQRELIPLNEQKETLNREISELKAVRDVFLEETTVLNARNEELAQLTAMYTRRMDAAPETPAKGAQESSDTLRPQAQQYLVAPSLSTSTSQSSIYDDTQELGRLKTPRSDTEMVTPMKPQNKFKWPGSSSRGKEQNISPQPVATDIPKGKAHIEHNFQQLSVLRFTRCDHCGDKMWGSQLRCSTCSTSIHVRCIANVQIPCTHHQNIPREEPVQAPMGPPMFGKDLTEQVLADSKEEERQVPVIVEKCIQAVEERALDYEGIYRKTGGSGQTKAITQLFERGDYASFDLCDSDRFNDICSVTSVLKTYFRSLPVPLLTFDLHDQFMSAIMIRDASLKQQSLVDLIDKLPNEHYFTLRMLMLHLNRVRERSERNLMNGRNLGVVFGPTLMRSRDPGAEFSDMAGKALFIEWLVDNAPLVFNTTE